MTEVKIKKDLKKLNNLIMGLKGANGLVIKVGILAGKNAREGKGSNASIGAIHEFGSYSQNIPERSFLKMPLTKKAGELVKEAQRIIATELIEGDVRPALVKIGNAAEAVIGEAFDTGGFGAWAPLSKRTSDRKGHDRILIASTQLEGSITSQVVQRGT